MNILPIIVTAFLFVVLQISTNEAAVDDIAVFVKGIENKIFNSTKFIYSLEDLALRQEKVLKIITPNGFARPQNNNDRVSTQNNNNYNNKPSEVSETDLYLLGAIEKIVQRLDLLDKRLQRTEDLVQHTFEGSNIKRQDPCPANFTKISRNCYYLGDRQLNWKSAASMCKSLGGNMIELESKEEYFDVLSYISSDITLRGQDYWTGGLNPGLLWIWSNSARPVVLKDSNRPEDVITGTGRCLKLSYSNSTRFYAYNGSDCSLRAKFLCEHEETPSGRALARIHKALKNA